LLSNIYAASKAALLFAKIQHSVETPKKIREKCVVKEIACTFSPQTLNMIEHIPHQK
jgi:hypothetical protein